jgi:Zn-dependent M28 family amino/carboxypeptidase
MHQIPILIKQPLRLSAWTAAASIVVACSFALAQPPGAKELFSTERIRADVKHISSDAFEGRGIGTLAEERTIEFIAGEFNKAGLKPAGERGTYFQTVPLIGLTTSPKTTLAASKGDRTIDFKLEEDFAGGCKTEQPVEDFDAEAIFVGHGITAPEFGWDDYGDIDVKGKVLIAFTNEPPSDDPKWFGGKALTYYGRWTYRYEEATRRGAKAMLIIHTNETAGYPYSVVQKLGGAQIQRAPGAPAMAFAGWLSSKAGDRLLGLSGMNVEDALKAANTKGFKAQRLGINIKAHIPTTVRKIITKNVIGTVPGSDPSLKDEAVMFTAHWDHLGMDRAPVGGDRIYNGAADNATGTAILLEMARAWAKQQPMPKRSAIFLSTTAEESGLLGAVYYAQHPVVPLGKTAIDLNFDMLLPLGVSESIVVNGAERTTAWPIVQAAARKNNLAIEPDKRAHLGTFFRSDHFALARGGVPAFSVYAGDRVKGKSANYVQQQMKHFIDKVYHTPQDEFREDWDFAGFPVVMGFAFDVAKDVANADKLPTWLPGDEFRAAREKSGVK